MFYVNPACPQATFDCLLKTYGFLTPDLWRESRFIKSPFQEYTDLLAKPTGKPLILDDVERIDAWGSSLAAKSRLVRVSNITLGCLCCLSSHLYDIQCLLLQFGLRIEHLVHTKKVFRTSCQISGRAWYCMSNECRIYDRGNLQCGKIDFR